MPRRIPLGDLLQPVPSLKAELFRFETGQVGFMLDWKTERTAMKKTKPQKPVEQPKPVTPGFTRAMVRQHAYEMFRDKLPNHALTLEDWVLAEKDLVGMMEAAEA